MEAQGPQTTEGTNILSAPQDWACLSPPLLLSESHNWGTQSTPSRRLDTVGRGPWAKQPGWVLRPAAHTAEPLTWHLGCGAGEGEGCQAHQVPRGAGQGAGAGAGVASGFQVFPVRLLLSGVLLPRGLAQQLPEVGSPSSSLQAGTGMSSPCPPHVLTVPSLCPPRALPVSPHVLPVSFPCPPRVLPAPGRTRSAAQQGGHRWNLEWPLRLPSRGPPGSGLWVSRPLPSGVSGRPVGRLPQFQRRTS